MSPGAAKSLTRSEQEALIQRLALLIVKAAVAAPHAQEQGDE